MCALWKTTIINSAKLHMHVVFQTTQNWVIHFSSYLTVIIVWLKEKRQGEKVCYENSKKEAPKKSTETCTVPLSEVHAVI